ncbi:hypothetical protein [Ornithinimicrobium cavernae]|uniref:hypothetical protein n=1 Tax=Ornithinimicrobium cavernae TaxID=2666047 RepID=UPI000D69CB38|nr:hypothetical protein [Ornithinimicrobium cavernae]
MTTLRNSHTAATATPRLNRLGFVSLIVGGAAFFASGPLHPTGSDEGDKTEQLHSMLVDTAWYPAHLVALLGFACVAAGLLALGHDQTIRDRLGRLLPISATVAVVAVLGAVIHLFAATQAAAIEHGGTTPLVAAFMGVETIVNPAWGLSVAALAVAGGRTRALGNRIVLPLGLLGGLAFALATATIAFIDTFDPLFPVAGLAGIWLVATGVIGLTRRPALVAGQSPRASAHGAMSAPEASRRGLWS